MKIASLLAAMVVTSAAPSSAAVLFTSSGVVDSTGGLINLDAPVPPGGGLYEFRISFDQDVELFSGLNIDIQD